jgi:hypothetical protein
LCRFTKAKRSILSLPDFAELQAGKRAAEKTKIAVKPDINFLFIFIFLHFLNIIPLAGNEM